MVTSQRVTTALVTIHSSGLRMLQVKPWQSLSQTRRTLYRIVSTLCRIFPSRFWDRHGVGFASDSRQVCVRFRTDNCRYVRLASESRQIPDRFQTENYRRVRLASASRQNHEQNSDRNTPYNRSKPVSEIFVLLADRLLFCLLQMLN